MMPITKKPRAFARGFLMLFSDCGGEHAHGRRVGGSKYSRRILGSGCWCGWLRLIARIGSSKCTFASDPPEGKGRACKGRNPLQTMSCSLYSSPMTAGSKSDGNRKGRAFTGMPMDTGFLGDSDFRSCRRSSGAVTLRLAVRSGRPTISGIFPGG